MFSNKYSFRYGDLDSSGKIKVSTILDLLQDISGLHLTDCGVPPEKLSEMNLAFLLEGWHVRFEKPLDRSDATVSTGIMRMTDIRTNRKYEIHQNGDCAVRGTAVWYAVDTERMRVARLSDDFFGIFDCISEEDNNLPYISLRPGKDLEFIGERVVEKRDLDTNHHLNNVKSVEIVLDFLPDDFLISELSVKYRKEILKNENIKIFSKQTDDAVAFEVVNEAGDVCIMVEAR